MKQQIHAWVDSERMQEIITSEEFDSGQEHALNQIIDKIDEAEQ